MGCEGWGYSFVLGLHTAPHLSSPGRALESPRSITNKCAVLTTHLGWGGNCYCNLSMSMGACLECVVVPRRPRSSGTVYRGEIGSSDERPHLLGPGPRGTCHGLEEPPGSLRDGEGSWEWGYLGSELPTCTTAIWGQREAAAFAFAAAAAVKKAGGHPEAGNASRCHPQLLPASSFTDSAAPLCPRQPLSHAPGSGRQLCTPHRGRTSQVR